MKDSTLLTLPLSLAVRRLALEQLDAAAKASARVKNNDDAEALHDFRVALRRLRSILRAYAPWYDPAAKNLHKRLRHLARATNTARDTEVQIEWLRRMSPRLTAEAQSGVAWLLARLTARQRKAHRVVRKLVRNEFANLEPRLRAALQTGKPRHDKATTTDIMFAHATRERLSVYSAELAADLAGISAVTDHEAIHAARIGGKRLRYLLEPLRRSIPGTAVLVNTMKAFQDRLGELNDRFIMAREIAQAVERADAQAEQVLPGLLELTAWIERDTIRRYRVIRARYLGRHAGKMFTPMSAFSRKLDTSYIANDSKPRRVRSK